MKISTKILFLTPLSIGILLTLLGSLSGEIAGVSAVLGGGLFMALGITIFILKID